MSERDFLHTEAYALQVLKDLATKPLDAKICRLVDALDRISKLTPDAANARDARDLHLTVKAIADTALSS